jgi:hypothetical protein
MTVAQTGTQTPEPGGIKTVYSTPQLDGIGLTETAPPPEGGMPPLPEARASLNFKAMIGGYEVQMTLRDDTEGAILARLQVLLKRPDIRPVPKPAPRSGSWKQRGR